MIGLQDIHELIVYALWSGYVARERPVSILIVAAPEHGKTVLVQQFKSYDNIIMLNDATGYGISTDPFLQPFRDGKKTHIIVPDLILPLSRKKDKADTFIATMNALMEDGYVAASTFAMPYAGANQLVRAGFISTITPDFLADRKKYWNSIGHLSRYVPISYSYSVATADAVRDYIASDLHSQRVPITPPTFPTTRPLVTLPRAIGRLISSDTKFLIAKLMQQPSSLEGFRLQHQLQRLAKSRALSQGRHVVEKQDATRILDLAERYMNFSYTEV